MKHAFIWYTCNKTKKNDAMKLELNFSCKNAYKQRFAIQLLPCTHKQNMQNIIEHKLWQIQWVWWIKYTYSTTKACASRVTVSEYRKSKVQEGSWSGSALGLQHWLDLWWGYNYWKLALSALIQESHCWPSNKQRDRAVERGPLEPLWKCLQCLRLLVLHNRRSLYYYVQSFTAMAAICGWEYVKDW